MSDAIYTMKREYGIHATHPHSFTMTGHWVLRDPAGKAICVDQYQNDIKLRYSHLTIQKIGE